MPHILALDKEYVNYHYFNDSAVKLPSLWDYKPYVNGNFIPEESRFYGVGLVFGTDSLYAAALSDTGKILFMYGTDVRRSGYKVCKSFKSWLRSFLLTKKIVRLAWGNYRDRKYHHYAGGSYAEEYFPEYLSILEKYHPNLWGSFISEIRAHSIFNLPFEITNKSFDEAEDEHIRKAFSSRWGECCIQDFAFNFPIINFAPGGLFPEGVVRSLIYAGCGRYVAWKAWKGSTQKESEYKIAQDGN